jgi:hypothetical protein
VYTHITSFVVGYEHPFPGSGDEEQLLAPHCSLFTAYRVSLIVLILTFIPFIILLYLPALYTRRRWTAIMENDRWRAFDNVVVYEGGGGHTLDHVEPHAEGPPRPMHLVSDNEARIIRPMSLATAGWTITWGWVAVVCLWRWVTSDE